MDETKLYSWFLGPKAENADMLERLVLDPVGRLGDGGPARRTGPRPAR